MADADSRPSFEDVSVKRVLTDNGVDHGLHDKLARDGTRRMCELSRRIAAGKNEVETTPTVV